MVQKIRRRRIQEDNDDSDSGHLGRAESLRRKPATAEDSWKTCLQFLVMSALIPGLFFLRMAFNDDESFLRYKLTLPESLPAPFESLPDLLRSYADQLRHQSLIRDDEWLGSDIVELHHCRSILTAEDSESFWGNFTTWAKPWVNETLRELYRPNFRQKEQLTQEVILELLEIYATNQGYCNFDRYRPTVSVLDSIAREKLLNTADMEAPSLHARCAFVIAIRRRDDVTHIQRLVEAIHMPQHFIILYLEREEENNQDTFVNENTAIADGYDNVVVLRFRQHFEGVEDPLSNVHLRIMRLLSIDLDLTYDYHVTLDGTSFPLLPAGELAKHLFTSSHSVWLGALTEKGMSETQLREGSVSYPCSAYSMHVN